MATTIRSTALDFNNIKDNLKTFLAAKEEFKDYNFEASGLSNILDVLAHNTHMNALIANFALNESYLGTAQLRSSIVSLAEGLGYVPDTDTSSQGVVNLSFTTSDAGRDTVIQLPAKTLFTGSVDDVTYTFQTIEDYYATDDGTGFYEFVTANGSNEISLFEGTQRTKTFLVGEYVDNPTYVIPDKSIDVDTVTVSIYESLTSTTATVYTNIINATTIDANSTIYILKESPNGFFELSFGDGETFGVAPEAGSKIVVEYLSTKGSVANGATIFTPSSSFTGGGVTGANISVTTVTNSVGGDVKESIESIRKNAPFQYATQNRMVTAADYSSLILRNYSTLINDIKAWGGEDNIDPEFGAVYVSIDFEDDVTELTQANTKQGILQLAEDLAVISFRLRFADPVTTNIEVQNFFQFNPRLTSLTLNAVQSNVLDIINKYFSDNTGGFEKSFRRSNLLTLIDESNPAILSSRAEIKMQQRFFVSSVTATKTINNLTNFTIPDAKLNEALTFLNTKRYKDAANIVVDYASSASFSTVLTSLRLIDQTTTYNFTFPAPIATPDDVVKIVTSTSFTYVPPAETGIASAVASDCIIANKLGTTILQIQSTAGDVIVENIGSYSPATGKLTLTNFTPEQIIGGRDFLKISVTPANQSAIVPTRNNILQYDREKSAARGVITTATN